MATSNRSIAAVRQRVEEDPQTSQALAIQGFSPQQSAALMGVVPNNTPNQAIELYARVIERTGLDPFTGQIHLLPLDGKFVPFVGVHGLRLIAQRSRRYGGTTEPEWTADGEHWVKVWLSADPPAAARVGVRRLPDKTPTYRTAVWARSAKWTSYNGQRQLRKIWAERGPEMLAKVAEADALRTLFPNETAGLEIRELADEDEEFQEYVHTKAKEYDEIFTDAEAEEGLSPERLRRLRSGVPEQPVAAPQQPAPVAPSQPLRLGVRWGRFWEVVEGQIGLSDAEVARVLGVETLLGYPGGAVQALADLKERTKHVLAGDDGDLPDPATAAAEPERQEPPEAAIDGEYSEQPPEEPSGEPAEDERSDEELHARAKELLRLLAAPPFRISLNAPTANAPRAALVAAVHGLEQRYQQENAKVDQREAKRR